ncbi:LpqB family beta-propeller domain-containing protein [Streptomyces sp. M19]
MPGPFGKEDTQLGTVAVSRDERMAAGVTRGGDSLYVTELAPGAERGPARLHSAGGSAENGLTAPSWDGLGSLWVADRDPNRPRLLRLPEGVDDPEEVAIPGWTAAGSWLCGSPPTAPASRCSSSTTGTPH